MNEKDIFSSKSRIPITLIEAIPDPFHLYVYICEKWTKAQSRLVTGNQTGIYPLFCFVWSMIMCIPIYIVYQISIRVCGVCVSLISNVNPYVYETRRKFSFNVYQNCYVSFFIKNGFTCRKVQYNVGLVSVIGFSSFGYSVSWLLYIRLSSLCSHHAFPKLVHKVLSSSQFPDNDVCVQCAVCSMQQSITSVKSLTYSILRFILILLHEQHIIPRKRYNNSDFSDDFFIIRYI